MAANVICIKSSAIHEVRPHAGQRLVAERLRSLLVSEVYPSEIAGKCGIIISIARTQGTPGGLPYKNNWDDGIRIKHINLGSMCIVFYLPIGYGSLGRFYYSLTS